MKCSICGGTKKSGYVQRLIAEGNLDASKVSNPSKFITNLGKAHRKRIDISAPSDSNISNKMEVPKRKLRKAPVVPVVPVVEAAKTPKKRNLKAKSSGICPYCKKEYALLSQHITKAHKHFYIEFNKSGEEPTMTVTDQDGKVLVKDQDASTEGEDVSGKRNWGFYFESKAGEGNQVTLYENDKVEVDRDVYSETTGKISSANKAFKNWSVKFV